MVSYHCYRKFPSVLIVLFGILSKLSCYEQCGGSLLRRYVSPGKSQEFNSPGYPDHYKSDDNCTWTFTTRRDAMVHIDCPNINVPKDESFCKDYLLVTLTSDLRDGTAHCTPFKLAGPLVTVQLIINSKDGGEFQCDVWSEWNNQTIQVDEDCECGWTYNKGRIVGGTETQVNEFPSLSALINVQVRRIWCGATIISNRIALTASHCVYRKQAKDFGLLIGEHDLMKGSETSSTILLKVSKLIHHEGYEPFPGLNDIAIVITAKQISFTSAVGPACLPFNYGGSLLREYITVVGWGTTEFGGEISSVPQKAEIQVVPAQNCSVAYDMKFDEKQHLCTYSKGKDACQFDSGGPLYYEDPLEHRQIIVGIVNHGKECGGPDPAVNLKVHTFLEWITNKVPSAEFCVK